MLENKNQCPFCKEIFDTPRKRGCHQRLCLLNPVREQMLNALRRGGSITATKLNSMRKKEKFTYTCYCLKCNKEYTVECTKYNYEKGNYKKYCSLSCANSRICSDDKKEKIRLKLIKPKPHCLDCNAEITNRSKSGYCKRCVVKHRYLSSESYKKFRLAGLKSCQIQAETRRSKNEIAFCELCENRFKTVKHNEALFNGWDADIIIEDLKVAILWNGKWHYEKIKANHSVKQVQNRDRLKIKEIENCGYKPYIIKDLGKFDLDKVNEEFKLFLTNMGL